MRGRTVPKTKDKRYKIQDLQDLHDQRKALEAVEAIKAAKTFTNFSTEHGEKSTGHRAQGAIKKIPSWEG